MSMVKEAESSQLSVGAQSPAQRRSKLFLCHTLFVSIPCFLSPILDFVTEIVTKVETLFRKSSQQSGAAGGADKAQMAFKLYDRDKDGYITKAEMVKLSKNLTKEQVEKVLIKPSFVHPINYSR